MCNFLVRISYQATSRDLRKLAKNLKMLSKWLWVSSCNEALFFLMHVLSVYEVISIAFI